MGLNNNAFLENRPVVAARVANGANMVVQWVLEDLCGGGGSFGSDNGS